MDREKINNLIEELFEDDPSSLVDHVIKNAKKGDPQDFLRTVDEYCWNNKASMNVGDTKGALLDSFFKESEPTVAVELGSFMGYSAVRMARLMKPGGKLYAIEIDPTRAKFVRQSINFTGLADKVTVINESTETALPSLKSKYGINKIDFVFIDHKKELYKDDLIRLIDAGFLNEGSVVVADNVVSHDISDYLEFVRSHPKFSSEHFESILEYSPQIKDGMEKSIYLG